MKITVTGATGFVGRHVLKALAHGGMHDVTATGRGDTASTDLVDGVHYVAFDLTNGASGVFEHLNRPEVLIHLAWNGLPNYNSRHHFESELPAQYAFLKAMVEQGLSKLVVSGTCYEYGMVAGQLVESLNPQPVNAYAFAKDALRRQLEFLRVGQSFEMTWARLFYMYGEGQAPSSIYSQLMAAGKRGDTSFRMSKGDQLRDFLPVHAVAKALAELAAHAPAAGIINVCSGEPTSVRSLAEKWILEHGFGMSLELGHYPYPAHEPMAFWGDAGRMRELLRC